MNGEQLGALPNIFWGHWVSMLMRQDIRSDELHLSGSSSTQLPSFNQTHAMIPVK